jgi:beta-lactamase regulating signal transducer with metallopeptidase domain
MSEFAATLNQWGEIFWSFAWPMLWQSSLLILAVFAFDFVLARRIRASVRYVSWAVVLVKLILPPSLALTTSATWRLWRAQPATTQPLIQNYTVSYDNTLSDAVPLPAVPVALSPPNLSGEAWILVTVVVMAVGLLLWLVFRWLGVAGKVRRSLDAPSELNGILDDVRQLAGLPRRPRLKLIDETQSPAVYGLFRPVILLPKALVSRLSVDQIRAVLLHEIFHLRRGDVWVNCAQTLLQIAYWWHPLVWLANARLRRVREEAVDDAVMLTLRDGADTYAPTLLEVAKFAFRRPLASLGLIGILESRSALRQRVERLTDFRPPRKTGITFLSLCGVFAFCAVALPMGQGPAVDEPTAHQVVDPASANENAVFKQADSALNDAFAAERKAAHMNYVLFDPVTDGKTSFREPPNFVPAVGLETRTFSVYPRALFANLDKSMRSLYPMDEPTSDANVVPRLQQFFLSEGVDLGPPKTIFYGDRLGVLFVSATPQDLDVIEKSIRALSEYPPILHIKSWFIEVPQAFFSGADANALPPGMTNGGILTATEMKNVWRLLSSQPGSEELAEPEVTTISGRQIQMRATVTQEVVANFPPQPLAGAAVGSKLVPQSERVETGSILDVVPDQLGDSYTINLTAIATQIDFLGYRTSNGLVRNVASNAAGTGVLPLFQVRDASLSRNLWDHQTLVLFPKAKTGWSHVWGEKGKKRNAEVVGTTEENGDKVLVVLTTATMLDAAGNRIHSDYELPFAQNAVPRQSP